MTPLSSLRIRSWCSIHCRSFSCCFGRSQDWLSCCGRGRPPTKSNKEETSMFYLLQRFYTIAARWITCVGRYFLKAALVDSSSRRLASLEERNTHSSLGCLSSWMTLSMPFPTKPLPPVTMIIWKRLLLLCCERKKSKHLPSFRSCRGCFPIWWPKKSHLPRKQ